MDMQERQYAEKMREAYAPASEERGKLEQLRGLDRKVRRPADIFAYTFGIVGALVLGVGMCLAMEVIGNGLMAVGIVVGVAGIAMVAANYFIYRAVLRSRKKKYAEQIISLSGELLGRQ